MATDDKQVKIGGTMPAPASWVVPGAGQIMPKTIFASYDGTAAGSAFFPALEIFSDAGLPIGLYPTSSSVAAGASALVSWFPGVMNTSGATGALTADFPQNLDLPSNYTLEWRAISATAADVSGAVVSQVSIFGTTLGLGTGEGGSIGDWLLVPGPGA